MSTALLLSGGMDSIALAFWKRPKFALTVNYGQQAAQAEIQASGSVAAVLGIEQYVINSNIRDLGCGEMAGTRALAIAPMPEWWPYRNQMLITLAAMKAIGLGVTKLLIGTVRSDRAHADGRPEFVSAMSGILEFQEGGLSVEAPAIEMSTAELIKVSKVPPEILAWAHSCHVADHACGNCRGCRKHYETMRTLGLEPY